MSGRIGEQRVEADQLEQALHRQRAGGGKLGHNLVKMGLEDEEITLLLSQHFGVPSINLAEFEIDRAVIKLIPVETATK